MSEQPTNGLWGFAQQHWHKLPLRQALLRFQLEFQQSACLMIALCWLVEHRLLPSGAQLAALKQCADEAEQQLAPIRRLLREADKVNQADWHQALLRVQLEGEKLLLARLEALIERQHLQSGEVSLDSLVLQVLPEIGFCEGQTQLLAELVRAFEEC